jgi:4-amino-4-deoxy-L-arabinose transferase-like glycosyltransferase
MKKTLNFAKTGFDYLRESPQFIIWVGILVRLPLLFTPLTFSSDRWRQADTASIAYHFFVNGYKLFYPQVFWGGSGPGYVETEFQLYPFLVSSFYYFFGEQYWLGKLVSLILSVFAWSLFYLLAKKVLVETRAAIWALTFLIFSPLYLRYSVAFMPEATVMLFYIAALNSYMNWISTSKKYSLFLCALYAALAILVKPTSIHLGLVFALVAFNSWGLGILRRWEIWLSILIALLPSLFWYVHARNLYLTYGNTFGLLSGGDSKFGNLHMWLSPSFYLSIFSLETKWVLGYAAIFPFVIGIWLAFKDKASRFVFFGVATIGLYYLIVARYAQESWGIQYHIYMLPFAALAVGFGVKWIINKYQGFALRVILWPSLAVFFSVTTILFLKMLSPGNDGLLKCAAEVNKLVPRGERILVSTTSNALSNGIENNYQEPDIFFYSKRYGWSLAAEWHTLEKVLEFRRAGATYFVIYSKALLDKNPSLTDYLKSNSTQIGPGIEAGCGIYRFLPVK